MNLTKILSITAALLIMLGAAPNADARTAVNPKGDKKNEEAQRSYTSFYDQQKNTVSNIEFYTTNYGIFGLDVRQNVGGGYWPRGSQNQYIFGGGIWFAAQKRRTDSTNLFRKMCEITYNPNNGRSWMVPGRIDDGEEAVTNDILKYRTYLSTDFVPNTGDPINEDENYAWPIWDSSTDPNDTLKNNRYFGYFIYDTDKRNTDNFAKGPAFISGEDIFCTYKDTDVDQFDGGAAERVPKGYPFRLQFEQMIYSWGFGDYKDFIFIKYDIINFSNDTLFQCWMAPVMDIDIARRSQSRAQAANDRCSYHFEDTTLNMAYQWTNTNLGEEGYGFGYLGFDFLESPAVDEDGFVRSDKRVYTEEEQLGLKTFYNWPIEQDINIDDSRYNQMASGVRDGDKEPGDKRFMMATGPFNFVPGDTVRVVVGIILAQPAAADDADGSIEDRAELVRKDKFAQKVYDENFRAPMPPDRTQNVWYEPSNESVKIWWDESSERTVDDIENGLDFMGYRIYRARNPVLDTFNVDEISPNLEYSSGAGPLGWKQVAQYELPTPFYQSQRLGVDPYGNEGQVTYIDSLEVVGPVYKDDGTVDSLKIKVMRVGRGVRVSQNDDTEELRQLYGRPLVYVPLVTSIDTSFFTRPWGEHYRKLAGGSQAFDMYAPPNNNFLLDSVLVGTIELEPSKYNWSPYFNTMYYKRYTVTTQMDTNDVNSLPDPDPVADTIWLKSTYKEVADGVYAIDIRVKRPINALLQDQEHMAEVLDTVYSVIQRGLCEVNFPDWESSDYAIDSVIIPYMTEITDNRTFYDIGDDNRDGYIQTNTDVRKTEKLINNVDYYYKVLAYDQGDYTQTPAKMNDGSKESPNVVMAIPKAGRAAEELEFEITHIDSNIIGGLYNFRFFSSDPQRAQQKFGGKEFELEFQPYWNQLTISPEERQIELGLYYRRILMRELESGDILFDGVTRLEPSTCDGSIIRNFTEDTRSWIYSDGPVVDSIAGDTNYIGTPFSDARILRSGSFETGNLEDGFRRDCYGTSFDPQAFGTLGFGFDFSILQHGGVFRGEKEVQLLSGDAQTLVTAANYDDDNPADMRDLFQTTMVVAWDTLSNWFPYGAQTIPDYGSFNNGPGEYVVRFKPGGTETLRLRWGGKSPQSTTDEAVFDVPYLNIEIENVTSYMRQGNEGAESADVEVTYPGMMEPMVLPVNGDFAVDQEITSANTQPERYYYPNPRVLKRNNNDYIGKYNMSAYGYIDGRNLYNPLKLSGTVARPYDGPAFRDDAERASIGSQNRYYLTAQSQDGQHTLDFTHMLNISGVTFGLDYAYHLTPFGESTTIWGPENKTDARDSIQNHVFGQDFQAGDEILVKTTGGAVGYPMPGAKVRFRVNNPVPEQDNYTESILEEINVVPNPYYITHQAQRSPYDGRIYFTRLPKRCTIDIYTVAGNLVRSIEHDEYNTPNEDNYAVEIWDLLSKNTKRVQSQSFVAVITTPNGEAVQKNFSVLVGGFRLVEEN